VSSSLCSWCQLYVVVISVVLSEQTAKYKDVFVEASRQVCVSGLHLHDVYEAETYILLLQFAVLSVYAWDITLCLFFNCYFIHISKNVQTVVRIFIMVKMSRNTHNVICVREHQRAGAKFCEAPDADADTLHWSHDYAAILWFSLIFKKIEVMAVICDAK